MIALPLSPKRTCTGLMVLGVSGACSSADMLVVVCFSGTVPPHANVAERACLSRKEPRSFSNLSWTVLAKDLREAVASAFGASPTAVLSLVLSAIVVKVRVGMYVEFAIRGLKTDESKKSQGVGTKRTSPHHIPVSQKLA